MKDFNREMINKFYEEIKLSINYSSFVRARGKNMHMDEIEKFNMLKAKAEENLDALILNLMGMTDLIEIVQNRDNVYDKYIKGEYNELRDWQATSSLY